MSQVFDDALLQHAASEAARALAENDPDTLAGRFMPRCPEQQSEIAALTSPRKRAAPPR